MKLSKTFDIPNGDSLVVEFDYNRESNSIVNLEITAYSHGKGFDLTPLFEDNYELYQYADTIIDNIIKAQ